MSPETGIIHGSILEESARISKELLAIERVADEKAHIIRMSLLSNLREDLGYEEIPDNAAEDIIDTNIKPKTPVITPELLSAALPVSIDAALTTRLSRKAAANILRHQDGRMIAIVGPCSIHDPEAALEYSANVRSWRREFGDDLEIIMRAYMEKPRTEIGWKGFVYDP
jgi:hypothetical protein